MDLTKFDNINRNVNLFFMFNFCITLKELDLSKFEIDDISKMLYMFNCCKSLKLINLKNIDLENKNLTDLIFKNISEDCKIICRDKIGLKNEIVKNDIVDYRSIFLLNNDCKKIRKMKELRREENIKLKNTNITQIKSKIFLFQFLL